jgi:hypothetical protein
MLKKYIYTDELPLETRMVNDVYPVGLFSATITMITRFSACFFPVCAVYYGNGGRNEYKRCSIF